jgi:hypothetical protein
MSDGMTPAGVTQSHHVHWRDSSLCGVASMLRQVPAPAVTPCALARLIGWWDQI